MVMNVEHLPDEVQKLEGPDYITVVVEWPDDDADTMVRRRPGRAPRWNRTLATMLGALGAIALTTWGLRRLKPA